MKDSEILKVQENGINFIEVFKSIEDTPEFIQPINHFVRNYIAPLKILEESEQEKRSLNIKNILSFVKTSTREEIISVADFLFDCHNSPNKTKIECVMESLDLLIKTKLIL